MAQDAAFQKRIQRIGELVEQLETAADPNARALAKEFLECLMALHGAALERILELASESGDPGDAMIRKCGNDELVSSVLLLYGLHPESLQTRVTRALEKTRAYLETHAANAELVSIGEDGTVTVRLEVKSSGCGSSAAQIKSTLEAAIQNAAPDAASIVVEEAGALLMQSGFVSVAQLQSSMSKAALAGSVTANGAVTDVPPALPTPQDSAFAALRQFARKRRVVERCEMCSLELAEEHEHLVEPVGRKLICACGACAILFEGQRGTKYRRVPRDVLFLQDFQLTDAQWDGLMVPIEMAFFFKSSPQEKIIALYPSPAGPTESLLSLDTWADIVLANPILSGMQDDVTALLVNRVGHVRGASPAEYYLVPIDECYKLVGLIRTHWRGLSGGTEVWREIGAFFAGLKKRAGFIPEGAHV